MTTLGKADRRYLDELTAHLQLHDVAGDRIGEIVAEAEAHGAATGEPLREAFGDPKEYAQQWAGPRRSPSWGRAAMVVLLAGLGSAVLTFGATALATGPDSVPFGLPAWLLVLVGTLVVTGTAAVVRTNPVRDPRTGARRGPGRGMVLLVALGLCAVVAAAGVIGGLLS